MAVAALVLLPAMLMTLAGCAAAPTSSAAPLPPAAGLANRPDGEGYAGVGELLVRIGVQQGGPSWTETLTESVALSPKHERAYVEIRYQGLDSLGRAVFERRDGDALAAASPNTVLPRTAKGTVLAPAAPGAAAADTGSGTDNVATAPNTRDIAMDLRLSRQLHIQGKIVEVVEATASGVVFRLY